ncbi:MAG TPA: hypothetical protein VF913_12435 [Xanthobacteraceae bacterium]
MSKISSNQLPRKYTHLGDLQRSYRAARHAAFRIGLRGYLFDGEPAPVDVFIAVSRALYVSGSIDKAGMEETWLAGASEAERAALFSRIATGGWS